MQEEGMLQDKIGLMEGKVWGNGEGEGVQNGDVYYLEGDTVRMKEWKIVGEKRREGGQIEEEVAHRARCMEEILKYRYM